MSSVFFFSGRKKLAELSGALRWSAFVSRLYDNNKHSLTFVRSAFQKGANYIIVRTFSVSWPGRYHLPFFFFFFSLLPITSFTHNILLALMSWCQIKNKQQTSRYFRHRDKNACVHFFFPPQHTKASSQKSCPPKKRFADARNAKA